MTSNHTGPIRIARSVLGRRMIDAIRLGVIALLLSFAFSIVANSAGGIVTLYETFGNPEPLLKYPDSDDPSDPGLRTERALYYPGETIQLTIARNIRVEGSILRNLVYLSPSCEPRGVLVNTLESSPPAGYSYRTADVAQLPPDTKPGLYCLAGVQTVTTKYGTKSVPWRSSWFYVSERKDE